MNRKSFSLYNNKGNMIYEIKIYELINVKKNKIK
jgi:hypothetical protein